MPNLKPEQRNVVGALECACGHAATVLQNRAGYLYTQCPLCGTDQRNGAAVQADYFRRVRVNPGAVLKRPRNVPAHIEPIGQGTPAPAADPAPAPAPEPGAPVMAPGFAADPAPGYEPIGQADPDPTTAADPTPAPIGQPAAADPPSGGLLALFALLLAGGTALIFSR